MSGSCLDQGRPQSGRDFRPKLGIYVVKPDIVNFPLDTKMCTTFSLADSPLVQTVVGLGDPSEEAVQSLHIS